VGESENRRSATELFKKQLSLPFDQYQRYKVVTDALDILREDSGPFRVLDVGGGEEGIILRFLPDDSVEVLDQIEVEDVPGFRRGDAAALPYEDGAFDYVTSVDVYEHVKREERRKYLSELRRVARKGVLLAAPFDSEEVRGAERFANEFHRAVHLQVNVWLKEHAENGLPDLAETRTYFEGEGDRVSVLPNGYLPHWIAMISLTFYRAHLTGEMQSMAERLNAFYNEFMYRYDNAEPSYRHLLVALKEDKDVGFERITSPADHPNATLSSAFFSTFSATLPLAAQLKKKDAQIKDLFERLARPAASANWENASLRAELDAIKNSRIWRLLDKTRRLRLALKGRFGKGID